MNRTAVTRRTPASLVLAALSAMILSGCASNPDRLADPRDPFEPVNRGIYRVNLELDRYLLKPAAQAYRFVTPDAVDRSVTNFFDNVDGLNSILNNLLQGKVGRAGNEVGRMLVNSTVGFLGLFDAASDLGIPRYAEDLDQTLGYWGLPPGPFIMLPVLGPSSVRGTVGWAGDIYVDPFINVKDDTVYWGVIGLRFVDFRADRLAGGEIIEDAATDPYAFLRDAYLQRRQNLAHDGNPPGKGQGDLWEGVDFDEGGSTPNTGEPSTSPLNE